MELIGVHKETASANIRITTVDAVIIMATLYFEKRWLLKLQKSLKHKTSKFCYHTNSQTYIRRFGDRINIYGTGINVSLRGDIWIDNLKDIVDNIINHLYVM